MRLAEHNLLWFRLPDRWSAGRGRGIKSSSSSSPPHVKQTQKNLPSALHPTVPPGFAGSPVMIVFPLHGLLAVQTLVGQGWRSPFLFPASLT